jgi:cytoskeletal protein RodZ
MMKAEISRSETGSAMMLVLVIVILGAIAAGYFVFQKQAKPVPEKTDEAETEAASTPVAEPSGELMPEVTEPLEPSNYSSSEPAEPDFSQSATLISKMESTKALKVLDQLTDNEVVAVIQAMSERSAASLLDAMNPDRAARLIRAMAEQSAPEEESG